MKKLAKVLVCLIVIMMVFSLMACEKPNNSNPNKSPEPSGTPSGTIDGSGSVSGTVGGPSTPSTPSTPNSDKNYLGKDAEAIYGEVVSEITAFDNYTFNNIIAADMAIVMEGQSVNIGTLEISSIYKYAGENYWGKEEMAIKDDPQGMLAAIMETMAVEITCVDDVVYMSADGMQSIYGVPNFKAKDNGSFEDLQNATDVSLDVTKMPLYSPSADALAAGKFELADDGAILTVILSGAEAEAFHEKNLANSYNADLEYGDITYKVYLDEDGKMIKIEYTFDCTADAEGFEGMTFDYTYKGTMTVTNIATTTISAPSNASQYQQVDFIK